MIELRQLFEIFPNVKSFYLNGNVTYIQDAWPSTHITNLEKFYLSTFTKVNENMIPRSKNGYKELKCPLYLMVTGIYQGKFEPLKILKLTLDLHLREITVES